jgi:hypothetical protein
MSRIDEYREALESAADRETYLLAHSGLPGPRGNLELARAAAEVCSTTELRRWARLAPDQAPTGRAEEFLAFAGVLGLGWQLVKGDRRALDELRRHASDPRWRIREAVAMALQLWGEVDFKALAAAMHEWAHGLSLERRALRSNFSATIHRLKALEQPRDPPGVQPLQSPLRAPLTSRPWDRVCRSLSRPAAMRGDVCAPSRARS